MAENHDDLWVVRSKYDGLWWRPRACGYTQELLAAGVVDEETAQEWAHRKSPDRNGAYADEALTLAEALKGFEEGTVWKAIVGRSVEDLEEAKAAAEELRDAWVPTDRHTEFPWEM